MKTKSTTKFRNEYMAVIETKLCKDQVSEQPDTVKYLTTIFNFDDTVNYLIAQQYIASNNEYKSETWTNRKDIYDSFDEIIKDIKIDNEYSIKQIFNL